MTSERKLEMLREDLTDGENRSTVVRHPEVRARASLEGCTARAVALRGPLGGHLRVTDNSVHGMTNQKSTR
jgi:hypothetical protein